MKVRIINRSYYDNEKLHEVGTVVTLPNVSAFSETCMEPIDADGAEAVKKYLAQKLKGKATTPDAVLTAARAEAAGLVNEARAEGAKIVAQAKEEATGILEAATKEAADIVAKAETDAKKPAPQGKA